MFCIEHMTEMTPDHDYFLHSDFSDDSTDDQDGWDDDIIERCRPVGIPTYRYGGPNED